MKRMIRSSVTKISTATTNIPRTYSSKSTVNKLPKPDRLLVVSSYTSKVLIFTTLQIAITLIVSIIFSQSLAGQVLHIAEQLLIPALFVLIAVAIVIVIAVLKKFTENYALNVAFVIVYSTCLAILLGVSNTVLSPLTTFVIFVISLVIFTSALLIGAAIKTGSVDKSRKIVLSFGAIWAVIVTISVVIDAVVQKEALIGLDIVAEIILYIITIFLSHLTIGKSRYRLFYPFYASASIFLYTVFYLVYYQSIMLGSSICFQNWTSICSGNCSYECVRNCSINWFPFEETGL
ncbi:unnamed protein product [Schistosoma turkestanicum]|nr:unnamed protein product [Schistosoma turkestanicum]